MMNSLLREQMTEAARIMNAMAEDADLLQTLEAVASRMVAALRNGGKVLLAGNGGSAADAQHIAAELVGRFAIERPGLAALALTTDTSILTAVGNDYGYDSIFSRQIQANGNAGDVFIAYSTSGKSPNILHALQAARTQQLITVGLSGQQDSPMPALCDHMLQVPSSDTPQIQQAHLALGHALCSMVESLMFKPVADGEPHKASASLSG